MILEETCLPYDTSNARTVNSLCKNLRKKTARCITPVPTQETVCSETVPVGRSGTFSFSLHILCKECSDSGDSCGDGVTAAGGDRVTVVSVTEGHSGASGNSDDRADRGMRVVRSCHKGDSRESEQQRCGVVRSKEVFLDVIFWVYQSNLLSLLFLWEDEYSQASSQ